MAKYFTLAEMTRSTAATTHKIKNDPPPDVIERLTYLMEQLDKIRERWGAPIIVTSGYRSVELNKRIKGAINSQHIKGEAADITTGKTGANRVLFDLIRMMQTDGEIEFDQLIDENNFSWIHVSFKKSGNRNEIKHLKQ